MALVNSYLKSIDGEARLANNFCVREFACKDSSNALFVAPDLVPILQSIREHFNRAVTITSAYRTATHNTKVKGSPTSQHLHGTAADIKVSGVSPSIVAAYVETLMPNNGGIGIYNTFTHVDVRSGKSRWNG